MADSDSRAFRAAKDLVENPVETLAQELKGWLDPEKDDDRANLMAAILAMRNQALDGLIAIIGIGDDRKHLGAPQFDIGAKYEQQAIQAIVSKHASRAFEIEVHLIEYTGIRYPVIVVPGAGDMPVICKSQIGQGPKPALREGTIYVRTLNANLITSSAPASWKEIEDLFDVCFRKRESNYAEFFSKILTAADPLAIRSLVAKAKEISANAFEAFEGMVEFRKYALTSLMRSRQRNHSMFRISALPRLL